MLCPILRSAVDFAGAGADLNSRTDLNRQLQQNRCPQSVTTGSFDSSKHMLQQYSLSS
jgi:hypothetical protein